MSTMFGGGGQRTHFGQGQRRGPGPRQRQLLDLFQNALTGRLLEPQEFAIPNPLSMGLSGLEDALGPIFAGAFGPNRGVAGLLGPPGEGGVPAAPSFGRTQTREELGLMPPETAPPGFLPPTETVRENLPRVRVSPEISRQRRLENRLERLGERQESREAAGKRTRGVERKIRRTERRLGRLQERPRFLEPRA